MLPENAPQENETPAESPELEVPDSSPGGLGTVEKVTADDIIADDDDSPKADNKLPPPDAPNALESEMAGNVAPPDAPKKRGRKKMTDEEKARAKEIREAVRGNRAPDFSKLPSGSSSSGGGSSGGKVPRDYYIEACNLFFPCSFVAEKWLGPHWGIPIEERTVAGIAQKCLAPTDEQKQYLANMARWLEYEQFPELNARWSFLIATIGYTAPKFKQDPTPTRLKSAWEWVRVKIFRKAPSTEKQKET